MQTPCTWYADDAAWYVYIHSDEYDLDLVGWWWKRNSITWCPLYNALILTDYQNSPTLEIVLQLFGCICDSHIYRPLTELNFFVTCRKYFKMKSKLDDEGWMKTFSIYAHGNNLEIFRSYVFNINRNVWSLMGCKFFWSHKSSL